MINKHDFNSQWWGNDVGVVQAQDLMTLSSNEVDAQCAPYAWVEARAANNAAINAHQMNTHGFFHVDTQIRFKIRLKGLSSTPSLDNLEVKFADETPFSVTAANFKAFEAERFAQLPNCSADKIKERYALWSQSLIANNPESCLRVFLNGEEQGYFLSQNTKSGFELTLAMLHTGAKISGMHLYHKALLAYAERGHRLGGAGFSVYNSLVHNIYANLGARFLSTEDFWFRCDS
jgi:hypothetical protein